MENITAHLTVPLADAFDVDAKGVYDALCWVFISILVIITFYPWFAIKHDINLLIGEGSRDIRGFFKHFCIFFCGLLNLAISTLCRYFSRICTRLANSLDDYNDGIFDPDVRSRRRRREQQERGYLAQIKELRQRDRETEDEIISRNSAIEHLCDEMTDLRMQIEATKLSHDKETEKFQQKLSDKDSALQTKQNQVQELRKTNQDLTLAERRSMVQLGHEQEDRLKLLHQLQDAKASLETVTADRDRLQGISKYTSDDLKKIDETYFSKCAEAEQLKKQLQTVTEEKEQFLKAEVEFSKLQSIKDELQAVKQEKENISSNRNKLEEMLLSLQSAASKSQDSIRKLQEENHELKHKVTQFGTVKRSDIKDFGNKTGQDRSEINPETPSQIVENVLEPSGKTESANKLENISRATVRASHESTGSNSQDPSVHASTGSAFVDHSAEPPKPLELGTDPQDSQEGTEEGTSTQQVEISTPPKKAQEESTVVSASYRDTSDVIKPSEPANMSPAAVEATQSTDTSTDTVPTDTAQSMNTPFSAKPPATEVVLVKTASAADAASASKPRKEKLPERRIFVDPIETSKLYNSKFPHGHEKIPTSIANLQCRFDAISASITAQLKNAGPVNLGELKTLFGERVGVKPNNMADEELAIVLYAWGARRKTALQLGVCQPKKSHVVHRAFDYPNRNWETIWIHNNNTAEDFTDEESEALGGVFNHWEGLRPVEKPKSPPQTELMDHSCDADSVDETVRALTDLSLQSDQTPAANTMSSPVQLSSAPTTNNMFVTALLAQAPVANNTSTTAHARPSTPIKDIHMENRSSPIDVNHDMLDVLVPQVSSISQPTLLTGPQTIFNPSNWTKTDFEESLTLPDARPLTPPSPPLRIPSAPALPAASLAPSAPLKPKAFSFQTASNVAPRSTGGNASAARPDAAPDGFDTELSSRTPSPIPSENLQLAPPPMWFQLPGKNLPTSSNSDNTSATPHGFGQPPSKIILPPSQATQQISAPIAGSFFTNPQATPGSFTPADQFAAQGERLTGTVERVKGSDEGDDDDDEDDNEGNDDIDPKPVLGKRTKDSSSDHQSSDSSNDRKPSPKKARNDRSGPDIPQNWTNPIYPPAGTSNANNARPTLTIPTTSPPFTGFHQSPVQSAAPSSSANDVQTAQKPMASDNGDANDEDTGALTPTESAQEWWDNLNAVMLEKTLLQEIIEEREALLATGMSIRRIKKQIEVAKIMERNAAIDQANLEYDTEQYKMYMEKLVDKEIKGLKEKLMRVISEQAERELAAESPDEEVQETMNTVQDQAIDNEVAGSALNAQYGLEGSEASTEVEDEEEEEELDEEELAEILEDDSFVLDE